VLGMTLQLCDCSSIGCVDGCGLGCMASIRARLQVAPCAPLGVALHRGRTADTRQTFEASVG
jgi:hypothetical protein